MITRRTLALSPFALLLLSPEAWAEDDVVIPLDTSGQRPAVHLSLAGGAPENWVFDTGAAGSVINEDRASALDLPILGVTRVGSPIGGEVIEASRVSVASARIGDVVLPDFTAVAMRLPGNLDHTGVLSPNIFRGRLVRFDFARGEVRITDRANAPASEPTPYVGAHPLPSIRVSVNGRTFDAHLDTGAPHVVSFPYAEAGALPLAAPPFETGRARFVDGERTRYSAELRGEVSIGPLTLSNPQISMIDGLPFVNVGTEALRRMVVTLDPERRVSWAELA